MSVNKQNGGSNNQPPPLPLKNKSFLFFLATQGLGAFNDNVFKQLVLLLSVGYLAGDVEFQAVVQFLFAVPFLIFSGLAGDLSDRYSKGWLMTVCKVAEIAIALAGVAAFFAVVDNASDSTRVPIYLWLLALVAFCLGTQSAFFGPPKYGGLPELVRDSDLAPATGLTQMTTFLAIIFGVAVAGLLADIFANRLYIAGLVTVSIAVVGTLTSLGIKKCAASEPTRRISIRSFISVLPTLLEIFRKDPLMLRIMLVYSWFWFVGGMSLTAINALGRLQLGFNNFDTSLLVATTSIGIAIGSAAVGRLSHGKVRVGLIVPGLILLICSLISLWLFPVHAPTVAEMELINQLKNAPQHILNATQVIPVASMPVKIGTFSVLFLLGAASGFFSVPLLAFIQARPPATDKGKVFAAVNWLNWIFIVAAAVAYGVGIAWVDNRANQLLGWLGLLTAVVAFSILPSIFKLIRTERPYFVYIKTRQ